MNKITGVIGKYYGVKVIKTKEGILLDCSGNERTKMRVIELLRNVGKTKCALEHLEGS